MAQVDINNNIDRINSVSIKKSWCSKVERIYFRHCAELRESKKAMLLIIYKGGRQIPVELFRDFIWDFLNTKVPCVPYGYIWGRKGPAKYWMKKYIYGINWKLHLQYHKNCVQVMEGNKTHLTPSGFIKCTVDADGEHFIMNKKMTFCMN